MKTLMLILVVMVFCSGCASLGWTNEDSGVAVLASDVSIPANGSVKYTVERNPRTDPEASEYYRQMGVKRSALSWFGFDGSKAGRAKTHMDK